MYVFIYIYIYREIYREICKYTYLYIDKVSLCGYITV